MKVFKFGGASVRDAAAVMNVAHILDLYRDEKLVVVVSAMGKTTNLLEQIHNSRFHGLDYSASLQKLKDYHFDIAGELFGKEQQVSELFEEHFKKLETALVGTRTDNFDKEYDSIVSFGEIFSTLIISEYLKLKGFSAEWLDARKLIKTDSTFRNARVRWDESAQNCEVLNSSFDRSDILIIQGFIGSTKNGDTTTLGREGSDFTAAGMAYLLDAESVTIWKDVPGMLNADPKWFKDTVKLDRISFREAIELAYYGASVIHPKTIKPLQNKGIPLYIKSFIDPEAEGSVIQSDESYDGKVPSYIFKDRQVLVSVSPRDFSFVAEDNLKEIFDTLSRLGIHISLMENSAISFSFCIDKDEYKLQQLIEKLRPDYQIRYNDNLTLITIRHYNEDIIRKLTEGRELILEQRSRNTLRMIVR